MRHHHLRPCLDWQVDQAQVTPLLLVADVVPCDCCRRLLVLLQLMTNEAAVSAASWPSASASWLSWQPLCQLLDAPHSEAGHRHSQLLLEQRSVTRSG